MTPREELVNVLEVEQAAKEKLGSSLFAEIAGGDRRALERITFRPRVMVNTSQLDLTAEIFGQKMFAPILVGPLSEQKRFHAEGELATIRGAAAAQAVTVISSRSSYPLEKIAAETKAPFWYQVFPEPNAKEQIQQAVKLGAKAICISSGTTWATVDQLRKNVNVPVLIKGIINTEDARQAAERGISGIVVSSYGGMGTASSITMLPAIVDAAGGKLSILIDGGFRRGTDILKALALGAQAVLLGRPPVWGLAAYGESGVQTVLEMLQTELARNMAMCGAPNLKLISRNMVKLHQR